MAVLKCVDAASLFGNKGDCIETEPRHLAWPQYLAQSDRRDAYGSAPVFEVGLEAFSVPRPMLRWLMALRAEEFTDSSTGDVLKSAPSWA
jgi:hypothetical protein